MGQGHTECAFGTGNALLRYGIDTRCAKQPPVVREAFSEAFGVKNRLFWYGRNIRCAEQAFLAASVHKPYDFSRLWTLKEAYGKCIGAGIRLPLAEIAFTIHGDTIAFCHPQGDAYAFLQLLLPDAHIAAICIPKSNAVQQIQYHLPQLRVCESQYLPKGAFCHVTD